jgi:hypothetical protein
MTMVEDAICNKPWVESRVKLCPRPFECISVAWSGTSDERRTDQVRVHDRQLGLAQINQCRARYTSPAQKNPLS